MMLEKVMIQLGAKNLKCRGGWGVGSPPVMIEKVMIQLGANGEAPPMIEKVMIPKK